MEIYKHLSLRPWFPTSSMKIPFNVKNLHILVSVLLSIDKMIMHRWPLRCVVITLWCLGWCSLLPNSWEDPWNCPSYCYLLGLLQYRKACKCYFRALVCSPSALRLLVSSEMWSFCPVFNIFNYLKRHNLWYLPFMYHLLIIQRLINSWIAQLISSFLHPFCFIISFLTSFSW